MIFHCVGLSGQPYMLVHHSPSLMLSHRSSRNTMVSAGPGFRTWVIFLYLSHPAPPRPALSASRPLNQLSMEMLRTRGKDWPLFGPDEAMHGNWSSPGHRQMPALFPQYGHNGLSLRVLSTSQ